MADEFAKGFGILTGGGLVWFAISAWLTTESFEGTQLIAPPQEGLGTYGEIAIVVRSITIWFVIFGVLTFWVLIPAAREFQAYRQERGEQA